MVHGRLERSEQRLSERSSCVASSLAVRHAAATPAIVVSQEHAASGDDGSIEEAIVFKFAAGSQTFARQNTAGQVTSNVIGSWNTLTSSVSMALAGGGNPCAASRF